MIAPYQIVTIIFDIHPTAYGFRGKCGSCGKQFLAFGNTSLTRVALEDKMSHHASQCQRAEALELEGRDDRD